MAKRSAKDGSFMINTSTTLHCADWKFNTKAKLSDGTDSSTAAGYTEDIVGRKSATFTVMGYWDDSTDPLPNLSVGSTVSNWVLNIYGSQKYLGAAAIVESFDHEQPIGSGDPIKWTATLKVQGSWTEP